ncbi:GNAT family N-acetyltransferase [Terrarubrum flagellatum]|uniref:GNAT family N-acetyltransferase n=1 Tax=Terrirubrum flagellatum TaxID=2895980 RepID=UPI00314500B6
MTPDQKSDWSRPRQTARLTLRPPEPGDEAAHFAIFSHPEVTKHKPDPTPATEAESRDMLNRDINHWATHGFGRWAVLFGGEAIGFGGLSLYGVSRAEALNLGYHLHPSRWRGGFATELACHAVSFAFDEIGAQRVIGRVRAWNPGSIPVLERAGLTFREETELHGAPTLLYAIDRPTR